ncbi:neutral/alkaline non-lysosomal ceramidase N-terminal domain-containing protein, partial [Patulibacter defluvii]|uniref:neutral/alkaline non-lysosomal ceramidase N-terminal domain-containing protein n=1 Tax=Patulibacter defluvii TaxID=3095358 RepID=UPI002A752E43
MSGVRRLLPLALGAALLGAPATAAAHSEAEAAAEDRYAQIHPEPPRAVARGAGELRAAGQLPPAASYAATSPPPAATDVPAGTLRAGVGRADLTPPLMGKYFLGGWTRADRIGRGVSTRLTTSALVLERGGRRVALVAMADFAVPQGLQQAIAAKVADLGFSERDVIISATHTHSGTGGYANSQTLNTAAPGIEMILTNPASLAGLVAPAPADPQLYTFIVERVATAIRRAATGLRPAAAGWGHTTLHGITRNRSLIARLNDFGTSDPSKVPYERTIDPNVDVLRVDALTAATCTAEVRRSARTSRSAARRAKTLTTRARRARRAAARARGRARTVA